jgi:hypothetical protein
LEGLVTLYEFVFLLEIVIIILMDFSDSFFKFDSSIRDDVGWGWVLSGILGAGPS